MGLDLLTLASYIFNNYFIDIYFGNDKIMTEKISGPDACGMYCNVMERKVMKKSKGKKGNGGFCMFPFGVYKKVGEVVRYSQ